MADNFVYVDGQRCTPYMAWQLGRLKADFRARFGLEIYPVSGIRLHQEQIDIFLQRYVTAGEVRGRYVYDTRVWRGTRYYRISNAGTVAAPGESNHEIQGNSAAWDFADSGNDAGVSRAGSERSNWLRANAWRYDLEPEGFNFGEAWHYKAKNIYNAVPGGQAPSGSNSTPKESTVLALRIKDNRGTIHFASLEVGVFRHLIGSDNVERHRNVVTMDDAYTDLSIDELNIYLTSYGCDTNIYRVNPDGAFVVLDPRNGSVGPGNMWSAVNARFAELRALINSK